MFSAFSGFLLLNYKCHNCCLHVCRKYERLWRCGLSFIHFERGVTFTGEGSTWASHNVNDAYVVYRARFGSISSVDVDQILIFPSSTCRIFFIFKCQSVFRGPPLSSPSSSVSSLPSIPPPPPPPRISSVLPPPPPCPPCGPARPWWTLPAR